MSSIWYRNHVLLIRCIIFSLSLFNITFKNTKSFKSFLYTLRNSYRNKEGLYTVRNKLCLHSFIKLNLRFWDLHCYLNHLYSGWYGDLLYKDIYIKFLPKLFLQCKIISTYSNAGPKIILTYQKWKKMACHASLSNFMSCKIMVSAMGS